LLLKYIKLTSIGVFYMRSHM